MKPIYEKYRDDDSKLQYVRSEKTKDVLVASHFHESVEFVYLEKGEMGVTVNGESFAVKAGDGIFVNSFDLHSYSSKKGNVTHLFIMGKALTDGFYQNESGSFPAHLDNAAANAEIMRDVLSVMKYAGDVTTDGAISCLLLGMLKKHYSLTPKKQLKEANIIKDILNYIDEHYAEDLTLEYLSAEFGYSPNHFSRLFNTYLGTHLRDYLNSVRVYYVRELLAREDITVTDALYKCGFDSHSTFYRAYKKSLQNENK